MIKFLIKRILQMIPVLLGVIIIVFFVSRAMPGDPVQMSMTSGYTEEQYNEQMEKLGLDKPVLEQLGRHIWGIVTRFDLGTSYKTGAPVLKEIGNRVWVTLRLGLLSILVTALIGIPIGILSATHQYSPLDYSVTALSTFFAAMPGFWLALMAIILFTQNLGWLPATGLSSWKHYILPVFCNALMSLAITARMTRSSMLEVIRQDYITTARAKGLKEGTITRRHSLKNALIPVITVIGNQCSAIIGGTVVIESIFTIQGMGTLLISSVDARDYPVVIGVTFIVSLFVCVINLIVDIIYCIVDPRMKAQLISPSKRRKVRRQVLGLDNEKTGAGMAFSAPESAAQTDTAAQAEAPQQEAEGTVDAVPEPAAEDTQAQPAAAAASVAAAADPGGVKHSAAVAAEREQTSATHGPGKKQGQFRAVWKRLRRNKLAMVGLVIVALLLVVTIFADVLAPYSYDEPDLSNTRQFPSSEHLLGTDNYGRDLLSRIIYGGRTSLLVGLGGVVISLFFSLIIGSIAGFFGKKVDTVVMRLMDILQAIPAMLLAVCVSAMLGTGTWQTAVAISIGGIAPGVRIIRAQMLTIRENEFVEAAKATGSSSLRIIFKHVLPNCLAPIIVDTALRVGTNIIAISALSFIGLGVASPIAEWGSILNAGRQFIRTFYPMVTFPGIAIMLTLFGFNLFGDGLRDALDPKMKR